MRLILSILITLTALASSCKDSSVLSLSSSGKNKIIALQPLDGYRTSDIDLLCKEISEFFNKRVIVLESRKIPETYFNPRLKQYSADSILVFLSHLKNDSIVEIVGFTHHPIFTIKEAKPVPYFDEYIFGQGYEPGPSCVVSDFKFATTNINNFERRLRVVTFHELGHNIGLTHCENQQCIMYRKQGSLVVLDTCGTEFCIDCKKRLRK